MPEDVRKLFIDHQSGKDADRPNLKACFDFLREGDTLIVESISRFARATRATCWRWSPGCKRCTSRS